MLFKNSTTFLFVFGYEHNQILQLYFCQSAEVVTIESGFEAMKFYDFFMILQLRYKVICVRQHSSAVNILFYTLQKWDCYVFPIFVAVVEKIRQNQNSDFN